MPIIFELGGSMATDFRMGELGYALETLTAPGFSPKVSVENPFPKKGSAWQCVEDYMIRIGSILAHETLPDCSDLDVIDDLRMQCQPNVLLGMKIGHQFTVETLREDK
ncbi:MAG TPA: hypothetical protein PKB09_02215 [Candidatus Saccharibacteria bacterium]|nr:hypothetical protein [Candidatus Saccharibacteria bacterium]